MTDDSTLERDLRAMLAARDPGAAPARLADRLRGAADESRVERARRRWSVATNLAGLVAAAAVVLAVAFVTLRPTATQPSDSDLGGVGSGASPPFDPTATGAGIASRPNDSGVIVVVLAALIVAATAYLRVRPRRLRVALMGITVLVSVGAIAVGRYDAVEWRDGAWAFGPGYQGDRPPPENDPSGVDTAVFVVAPDGILTFGVDVYNRAPLPITILGVAPNEHFMAWGDVAAVGLLRDPLMIDITTLENTKPFAPADVQPGERIFLIVAGRVSHCALGRSNANDQDQANGGFSTIDVVYQVAGFRRVTTVQLPFIVEVPMNGTCMTA